MKIKSQKEKDSREELAKSFVTDSPYVIHEPKHLTVSTVDIYLGGWRQDGKVHHLLVKIVQPYISVVFNFPAYFVAQHFLFALEK